MMQSHDCRRLVCHKGGSKSLYIFLIMGQEHSVRAHVDLLYKAVVLLFASFWKGLALELEIACLSCACYGAFFHGE